jgi:DNA-binding NarL/FixJ family response regulator
MGFFDLFRKKRKAYSSKRRQSKTSVAKLKQSFEKARVDIDVLHVRTQTINALLEQYSKELSEHKDVIEQHSARLSKLEQAVNWQPSNRRLALNSQPNRPDQASNPLPAATPGNLPLPQKLDVDYFSEQEKRILAVFFQNQGMALSYIDIARTLNKSPHTIKNQVRQMRLKADLFDRTVGDQSRNRFKLKDGLRIEKYLNVS